MPTAPGTAISDLAAASGTLAGEIDLTFSAATGADSVTVQVCDSALGVWADADLKTAIDDTSTGAIIENLTAGNTYNIRLVVVGGGSNGISNVVSAAAKA